MVPRVKKPYRSGFKKGCAAKDFFFGRLMLDSHHPSAVKDVPLCLRYPSLSQYDQLIHGTFTRHGGTSCSPYATLNTSYDVGDHADSVTANLSIIKRTLGASRLLFTRQVHGTEVLVLSADSPEVFKVSPEADAMITNIPRVALMIKQADCQGVILFDPTENVVANVHCGWRGNVQNILGKVIWLMKHHFSCRGENLVAVIGPSLGPCCAEFITHREIFPAHFEEFIIKENYFDLWGLSSYQLQAEGVKPKNITVSGICTRCHTDRFFSYRGEKITGRFATVAMLTI